MKVRMPNNKTTLKEVTVGECFISREGFTGMRVSGKDSTGQIPVVFFATGDLIWSSPRTVVAKVDCTVVSTEYLDKLDPSPEYRAKMEDIK